MRPVVLKIVRSDAEICVFCVQRHLDAVDVQTVVAASPWGPVKVFIGVNIVGLVESFGRFNRLLKPGLNMINPCSE